MNSPISPERKLLYFGGMALTVVGVLLFLSTFVTALMDFGKFDHFEDRARSGAFRAFGGMALILVGNVIRMIGAKGWAGSGIVLNPEQARKDVEPWSRMQGGRAQDALSEIHVVKKLEERLQPAEPQIKIRCRSCQALNDEAAKFCDQCGAEL